MHTVFRLFILLSLVFATSSCISHKQFDYAPISSAKDLEGVYYNDDEYPPKILKIESISDKKLQVSMLETSTWSKPKTYKGNFNKERGTFDTWRSRKIYPFVLWLGYDFEKERIGKDEEGNLIINTAHNHMGIVIPLGAGGDKYSSIKKYELLRDQMLLPTKKRESGDTNILRQMNLL